MAKTRKNKTSAKTLAVKRGLVKLPASQVHKNKKAYDRKKVKQETLVQKLQIR